MEEVDMSEQKPYVTESEYEVMKVLWSENKKFTLADVMAAISNKDWKITTVATLLTRLADKGAISYDRKGKTHHYYPILKQEEYNVGETKTFLEKVYNGSVKSLVASLYENDELSKEDIEGLKKMFDLE